MGLVNQTSIMNSSSMDLSNVSASWGAPLNPPSEEPPFTFRFDIFPKGGPHPAASKEMPLDFFLNLSQWNISSCIEDFRRRFSEFFVGQNLSYYVGHLTAAKAEEQLQNYQSALDALSRNYVRDFKASIQKIKTVTEVQLVELFYQALQKPSPDFFMILFSKYGFSESYFGKQVLTDLIQKFKDRNKRPQTVFDQDDHHRVLSTFKDFYLQLTSQQFDEMFFFINSFLPDAKDFLCVDLLKQVRERNFYLFNKRVFLHQLSSEDLGNLLVRITQLWAVDSASLIPFVEYLLKKGLPQEKVDEALFYYMNTQREVILENSVVQAFIQSRKLSEGMKNFLVEENIGFLCTLFKIELHEGRDIDEKFLDVLEKLALDGHETFADLIILFGGQFLYERNLIRAVREKRVGAVKLLLREIQGDIADFEKALALAFESNSDEIIDLCLEKIIALLNGDYPLPDRLIDLIASHKLTKRYEGMKRQKVK